MNSQRLTVHVKDEKVCIYVPDEKKTSDIILELIDRKDEINNIISDLKKKQRIKNSTNNLKKNNSKKELSKESSLNLENDLPKEQENKKAEETCGNNKNELLDINNYDIISLKFVGKAFSEKEQLLVVKTLDVYVDAKIEFERTKDDLGLSKIKKTYMKTLDISKTKFIKGSLRSGIKEEFKGSIVLLGDLNSGAELVAEGNIVILGKLRGIAHAGADGNEKAFIAANSTENTQIRIAKEVQEIAEYDKLPIFFIENGKIMVDHKDIKVSSYIDNGNKKSSKKKRWKNKK